MLSWKGAAAGGSRRQAPSTSICLRCTTRALSAPSRPHRSRPSPLFTHSPLSHSSSPSTAAAVLAHTRKAYSFFAEATDDSAEAVLFPKSHKPQRSPSPLSSPSSSSYTSPPQLSDPQTELVFPEHRQRTHHPTGDAFSQGTPYDIHLVQDRIALIHATLELGDLQRAEIIFNRGLRIGGSVFASHLSIGVINAFIEAFLKVDDLARAREWYRRTEEVGLKDRVKPVVNTFVAFLKYALKKGDKALVGDVVGWMEEKGVGTEEVIAHDWFLDRGERTAFEAIMEELGKPVKEVTTFADALLMSAMEDASSSSSSSTLSSSSSPTDTTSTSSTQQQYQEPTTLQSTATLGVQILQKALREFAQNSSPSHSSTSSETNLYKLQEWLEERSFEGAQEEYTASLEQLPDTLKHIVTTNTVTNQWYSALVPAIRQHIAELEYQQKESSDPEYVPHLAFLKL
ncbi:hypothetical protein HK097_002483, partial [Rhizophlyctis rosea]